MATLPVDAPSPNPMEGLGRMAPWRQAALLVALAASIAVGIGAAIWVQSPRYVALGQSFSPADMRAVTEALTREGIAHEIESGGTVLVDSASLQQAEFVLADSGLGSGATADHGEALRRGRRLHRDPGGQAPAHASREGARSRAHGEPLEARRHGQGGTSRYRGAPRFNARPTQSTASVMVELRPGRRLTPVQVESIRQLVAQGVEGMDPDQVVVTDQAGRLLGRAGEADSARQLDYVRNLEGHLLSKVSRILTPVTGPNGFAAEVTAQIDFTTFETYKVSYDPDSPAVRSRSNVEELNTGGRRRRAGGAHESAAGGGGGAGAGRRRGRAPGRPPRTSAAAGAR